jgi:hypothetical protein
MTDTKSWPDMAIDIYDKLTGRGAEISYTLENMEIWIPSGTGDDVTHAKWKVNGTLKISSRDTSKGS